MYTPRLSPKLGAKLHAKLHAMGNNILIIAHNEPYETSFAPPSWVFEHSFDQVLFLWKDSTGHPTWGRVFVLIFNHDGSEASLCGNGLACAMFWLHQRMGRKEGRFITKAGSFLAHHIKENIVDVNLGVPICRASHIPLNLSYANEMNGDPLGQPLNPQDLFLFGQRAFCVNFGVPHTLFFFPSRKDVDLIDLKAWGEKVSQHPIFQEGTNVSLVYADKTHGPTQLYVRVWERGCGPTKACGTGACAAAFAASRRGFIPISQHKIILDMPGGHLTVHKHTNNTFSLIVRVEYDILD